MAPATKTNGSSAFLEKRQTDTILDHKVYDAAYDEKGAQRLADGVDAVWCSNRKKANRSMGLHGLPGPAAAGGSVQTGPGGYIACRNVSK